MSLKYMPLGEVTTVIMGISPNGISYNNAGIGLPLLNGPTEFGSTYPNSTLFTTESKRACMKGDLIFCVRGNTTGRMNWADRVYSLGRGVCSIRGKSIVETRYIRYCLEAYLQELLQTAGGSTMPNLTQASIKDFRVPYHGDRVKIATILSTYDDLIENNLRRINILEEIAKTIYDEWFVKFHFPGYEKVKMVESELGLIPEGWEVKKVEELIEYHIGGGWGKELPDTKHTSFAYVIRGTDIPDAKYGGVDNIPLRVHSESNLKSRILQTNDIVFEVSGGSKDQPVGRALLINQNLSRQFDKKVMCASFCKLIRPRSVVLPELLFLHFQTIYDNRKIMQYQVQSTGITNFKFEYFLQNEPVLTPKKEVQDRFANVIEPIFDAIQLCGIRNTNLRKTRDFLLPKLISGEIDVENLDVKIEE